MKKDNIVKKIFTEKGHTTENLNNTSYYVKSINKLLHSGIFNLNICKKGNCWNHKGKKINAELYITDINGKVKYVRRCYYEHGFITPFAILTSFAKLIKFDGVIEFIQTQHSINIDTHIANDYCRKCCGKGIIESFKHVCDGICFDCGGSGIPFRYFDKTIINITK